MKSTRSNRILSTVLLLSLVIVMVLSIGTAFGKYTFSGNVGGFTLNIVPRNDPAEAIMNMIPEGGTLTRIVYDRWDDGYSDAYVTIDASEWQETDYEIYDPKQPHVRMFAKQHDGDNYTVYVLSAEDIYAPEDASRMLSGTTYGRALKDDVAEIVLHNFHFPKGAVTINMFNGCSALTSLDLSGMDFSTISSTKEVSSNANSGSRDRMFFGMSALTYLDLSDTTWNGKMGRFFYRSGYSANLKAIKTIDLRGADTQSVTDFTQLFLSLSTLVNVYGLDELDIADSCTSFSEAFSGCQSLSADTFKDVAALLEKETQVTNFAQTFTNCDKIDNATFHMLIDALADRKISSLDKAFQRCNVSGEIDISSLDLSGLTGNGLRQTFFDCAYISSIVFPDSIGGATSLLGTFKDCYALTTVDLSLVDTSKITNMSEMFYRCGNLTRVYVGDGWDTEAVATSTNMFYNCTAIQGGNGTTYDSTKTDKTYACIDTPETPGYLTHIDALAYDLSESIGVEVDVSDVVNALITANGDFIGDELYTEDGVLRLDIEADEGYIFPDVFTVDIDGEEYLIDTANSDEDDDIYFDGDIGCLIISDEILSQGSSVVIRLECVEKVPEEDENDLAEENENTSEDHEDETEAPEGDSSNDGEQTTPEGGTDVTEPPESDATTDGGTSSDAETDTTDTPTNDGDTDSDNGTDSTEPPAGDPPVDDGTTPPEDSTGTTEPSEGDTSNDGEETTPEGGTDVTEPPESDATTDGGTSSDAETDTTDTPTDKGNTSSGNDTSSTESSKSDLGSSEKNNSGTSSTENTSGDNGEMSTGGETDSATEFPVTDVVIPNGDVNSDSNTGDSEKSGGNSSSSNEISSSSDETTSSTKKKDQTISGDGSTVQ